MIDITNLSILEVNKLILNKEIKPTDLVRFFLDKIEQNKHLNAVLEVFTDSMAIAKEQDKLQEQNKMTGKLFGIPVLIKDNMLYKGHRCTCASEFLKDFVAVNNSDVVQNLLDENAIIIGRTNMDEFAMGSGTENSAFGACLNPLDNSRVPGGSSGGSSSSMAARLAMATLGSDTGGSIREPSSFCGIVGMKPTYGRVSRSGVVAFASSLDQVGPMTKNVTDNAVMLEVLANYSKKDETSISMPVEKYLEFVNADVTGLKIGIVKEVMDVYKTRPASKNFITFIENLKRTKKVTVKEISINGINTALPTYYIISSAEAASNLARFDGVKYSTRSKKANTIDEIYIKSRTEGFGREVKRRIMLGNFVLSSGFFDAYYVKAKKVQQLLKKEFEAAFSECDLIIMPTTIGEAYKLNDSSMTLIDTYLEDVFTVPVSIVGVPSMSIPYSKGENGLPLGLQIIGKHFDEKTIYKLAGFIERGMK